MRTDGHRNKKDVPVISVIMGTYNEINRVYTAQAVDSVLNQTFEDFEYIICDDGSDWEFFQWLQRFCKKDARIRLLRNSQNRGLAYTLNRCLKYAKGTYIARMDADDVSGRERFEKQAAFLDKHPEYALVGCNVRMIGNRGVWGIRRLDAAPDRISFLNTLPFVHPAVMIRRRVILYLKGYCESPKVLRVEDYEFFMRFYAAGYRGYNIQENLFSYREDLNSYKKKKYRYRINECRVRLCGFQRLGILKGNVRYILKPLAAGLIPDRIMYIMKRHRYFSASMYACKH